MRRDTKVRFAWVVAAVVLCAATPASFAAVSFGLSAPEVEGYVTSGNVVYVVVTNPGPAASVCSVVVRGVVTNGPVVASGSKSVPAGGSALVPVRFDEKPSIITDVRIITDGPSPF